MAKLLLKNYLICNTNKGNINIASWIHFYDEFLSIQGVIGSMDGL